MKKKHTPFNVIHQDFNKQEFEPYDIMPYFINLWKKNKKNRPATYADLKTWFIDEARYMFWSRCEYEIILAGWPNTETTKKTDIYEQIKMNIDIIVNIFADNIGFSESSEK